MGSFQENIIRTFANKESSYGGRVTINNINNNNYVTNNFNTMNYRPTRSDLLQLLIERKLEKKRIIALQKEENERLDYQKMKQIGDNSMKNGNLAVDSLEGNFEVVGENSLIDTAVDELLLSETETDLSKPRNDLYYITKGNQVKPYCPATILPGSTAGVNDEDFPYGKVIIPNSQDDDVAVVTIFKNSLHTLAASGRHEIRLSFQDEWSDETYKLILAHAAAIAKANSKGSFKIVEEFAYTLDEPKWMVKSKVYNNLGVTSLVVGTATLTNNGLIISVIN